MYKRPKLPKRSDKINTSVVIGPRRDSMKINQPNQFGQVSQNYDASTPQHTHRGDNDDLPNEAIITLWTEALENDDEEIKNDPQRDDNTGFNTPRRCSSNLPEQPNEHITSFADLIKVLRSSNNIFKADGRGHILDLSDELIDDLI